MIFDVANRHQLALDPTALTTITTTLTAMLSAIEDCRNAGVAPDSDPAVVLLARHMATVSSNRAPRAVLHTACRRKLTDIARFPALLALATRGVDYDSIAKDRFHAEGRAALVALATSLALKPSEYELTTIMGARENSGCVTLTTSCFVVMLRIGGIHEHREVLYRAVRDGTGIAPNHHAPVRALLKPAAFADRLRTTLGLPMPAIGEADAVQAHTAQTQTAIAA